MIKMKILITGWVGFIDSYLAEMLAKKLIGYELKTSLEGGLRKFVEWYEKKPSFYGRRKWLKLAL